MKADGVPGSVGLRGAHRTGLRQPLDPP